METQHILLKSRVHLMQRLSVMALFCINGWIYGNLASRLPDIRLVHGLPEIASGWGAAIFVIAIFSLRPFTAWLTTQFSSATLLFISGLVYILSFFSLSQFSSPFSFYTSIFLLGSSIGVLDLIASILGAQLEHTYHKATFSSLHATFSTALIFGAAASAWSISQEISITFQFASASLLGLAVLGWSFFNWPEVTEKEDFKDEKIPIVTIPVRSTWILGLVALFCIISETSIADWMARYITEVAGGEKYIAPWTLAAFSFSMAIGRIMGDSFRAITGDQDLLRDGAILASVGLIVCLIYPDPTVILLGVSLIGLGLSVVIPICYSLVSRIKGLSLVQSVSMLSILSSLGVFVGPAVIGALSSQFDLRIGYCFVLITLGAIVVLSRKIKTEESEFKAFRFEDNRVKPSPKVPAKGDAPISKADSIH